PTRRSRSNVSSRSVTVSHGVINPSRTAFAASWKRGTVKTAPAESNTPKPSRSANTAGAWTRQNWANCFRSSLIDLDQGSRVRSPHQVKALQYLRWDSHDFGRRKLSAI